MKRIAGVSLGQGSLSGCAAEAGFRSMNPAGFEDVPLPSGPSGRRDAIVAFLERWKKERAPQGLVLGLPLKNFSHHIVDLPSMGRNDMRKALVFELEKYLPMDVDEYYFDFLAMAGGKGRTQAVVFSVRKETVDDMLNLAGEAGLEVIAVRSSFLSALRGLADLHRGKDIDGVFVHVADDGFEIAGLRRSVPVYLKWFPAVADLTAEVERLESQYPGPVFFDGPDESVLGGRVQATRVHPRVAHLLALSAVRKGRFDLDFMPQGDSGGRWVYFPRLAAGLAAAGLILYLLTGLVVYYKDYAALREIAGRREAVRSRASGLLETKNKLDTLTGDLHSLAGFRGRSTVSVRALSSLSDILPRNAWLISLTADEKGRIEMEGFSARSSSVVLALEKSRLFRNVSYSAPIITKDGEERFALKFELAGPDE